VQRDEGGRGIGPLTQPGQLHSVASELFAMTQATSANGVIVLTGFPCMRDRTPPTETDGPPGAVAVARSLLALGVAVRLPIEDHSEEVLRGCALSQCEGLVADAKELVVGFPTADRWTMSDDHRLRELCTSASAVVCLERAGPASDGVCRTMRGFPMGDSLIATQLNEIVSDKSYGLRSVAIGDGGNELGLGALHSAICEHVPNGASIGCVVPTNAVLVASVSNWGGYALSHALALLAWDAGLKLSATDAEQAVPYLDRIAPGCDTVAKTILAANTAGAVDGITAQAGGAVDGMPLEQQCQIVGELRAVCLAYMAEEPYGGNSQ